jgi:fructose-specific phosphotransferase system IIC component
MASITDLRTGIATNLATITGLRTSPTIPDNINPPIAVVVPQSISYDTAFARSGGDEYEFIVTVIVGRVDERSAQNRLDSYCSGTGASSIKTAIEKDKTLGGKALTLRVTDLRNYTQVSIADATYLAAEFVVQVIA